MAAPAELALAVRAENLSVSYRTHRALEGVSIDVPVGSLFAILGPNGSGKSTFLKVLLGLVEPSGGGVEVLGRSPEQARRETGYVPQVTAADPGFPITAAEVVAMGLYGRRPRFRLPFRHDGATHEALEALSAGDLARRQFGELSGGQQRRVLLARALARDPQLLLLDEPAAGLDAKADEELGQILRSLADEGRTVIVATHDIGGVARLYDRAALLNTSVISSGSLDEVLTDEHLHAAFGRQLLAMEGITHGGHHDVTFLQTHE